MIFLESYYSKNVASTIIRFTNTETKTTPRTEEWDRVLFGMQGNQ